MLGIAPRIYRSRVRKTVCTSSTEAYLVASRDAMVELISQGWPRQSRTTAGRLYLLVFGINSRNDLITKRKLESRAEFIALKVLLTMSHVMKATLILKHRLPKETLGDMFMNPKTGNKRIKIILETSYGQYMSFFVTYIAGRAYGPNPKRCDRHLC